MPNARWWKDFYTAERTSLGERGMEALFRDAPDIELPERGAIIFPHTRLSASGHFTAAATRSVIETGCEVVLALGVLHSGDERGDLTLRGIHGSTVPYDKGLWHDEFSLDNFEVLLAIASRLAGKRMPKLIARYPFLTGEHPKTLAGFDELVTLVESGAAIVATADMIHHGAGYGMPAQLRLARENPETLAWAKREIEAQLFLLARKDFPGFLSLCGDAHSDFRDSGPVLAALLPSHPAISIMDIVLVNYGDVLKADEPTWVAAALAHYGA